MKTHLQFFFVFLVHSSLLLFTNGFAQTAPLEYYIQTYQIESGVFDGDGTPENNPVEVFSSVIELHSVPWLQLHFSDSNLGSESYIIIKSLYDGLWQKLNSVSLEQWNNFSAYFNGNAVEIKLFVAPIDRQVFINIDEIIEVSGGIMIARGDMGVSLPIYEIPIIQKMIIKKCNRAGKFVITATQMLESMTENPRPTRAEVTDVANAIIDGTDFVMLSAESAVGKYPVETVIMMNNIIKFTERNLNYL